MAAANCVLSEDQFLCPICLDVFTDPVTTTCGHNFCKGCIAEHWNVNSTWRCPLCKELFSTKPDLHTNTFISEMAAQFKQSAQHKTSRRSSSNQAAAKPGEVPCDICPGPKLKALKSCLVCLVSYCETHLEPHLTVAGLKRHQLMDPVENLESRMCLKHNKLLELFCRTDQTCVCMLCTVSDHKTHDVVPLKEEYEEVKAELMTTEAEIQQMIQERQQKIEDIKLSIDLRNESADREIIAGVQVFTALRESVDRSLDELIQTIEENQKSTEKQAKESINMLEQEISELMRTRAEVEQLSQTQDPFHLLQSVQSPNIHQLPTTKDWTDVSVHPSSYDGLALRAVGQLEETLREEVKKLLDAELKRVQQYAVDVTLDSDTANPYLVLSEDGKQVTMGEIKKSLSENTERFSLNPCVLGKQSISSGKFYFEVQVKGKTDWDLGVATESINRKEDVPLSPEDGYWAIWLRKRMKYKALTDPPVCLSLRSKPQKVGVFVDYEEGLVSFVDVDTAALIYSFTGCSFTEKLYPYFNPSLSQGGKNSTPLIITPVNHSPR